MISMQELSRGKCRHQAQALDEAAITAHLAALPQWQREGQRITRSLAFKNYYETLAFVNALAFIVHAEDHHPELTVTYNRCVVKFDTHSVKGLSENDFICAAKVEQLVAQGEA